MTRRVLKVDPGSEAYSAWAVRKAAQLSALARDLGLESVPKAFVIGSSTVFVRGFADGGYFVQITGSDGRILYGTNFGSETDQIQNPSRAAVRAGSRATAAVVPTAGRVVTNMQWSKDFSTLVMLEGFVAGVPGAMRAQLIRGDFRQDVEQVMSFRGESSQIMPEENPSTGVMHTLYGYIHAGVSADGKCVIMRSYDNLDVLVVCTWNGSSFDVVRTTPPTVRAFVTQAAPAAFSAPWRAGGPFVSSLTVPSSYAPAANHVINWVSSRGDSQSVRYWVNRYKPAEVLVQFNLMRVTGVETAAGSVAEGLLLKATGEVMQETWRMDATGQWSLFHSRPTYAAYCYFDDQRAADRVIYGNFAPSDLISGTSNGNAVFPVTTSDDVYEWSTLAFEPTGGAARRLTWPLATVADVPGAFYGAGATLRGTTSTIGPNIPIAVSRPTALTTTDISIDGAALISGVNVAAASGTAGRIDVNGFGDGPSLLVQSRNALGGGKTGNIWRYPSGELVLPALLGAVVGARYVLSRGGRRVYEIDLNNVLSRMYLDGASVWTPGALDDFTPGSLRRVGHASDDELDADDGTAHRIARVVQDPSTLAWRLSSVRVLPINFDIFVPDPADPTNPPIHVVLTNAFALVVPTFHP